MKKKIVIIISIILFSQQLFAEKILHPYNLNFENDVPGSMPSGWNLPYKYLQKGYVAGVTDKVAHTGKLSLELSSSEDFNKEMLASVFQKINASSYRGKNINYKAAVRLNLLNDSSKVKIWVKTHRKNNKIGFSSEVKVKRTDNSEWAFYEISGQIEKDADYINYGITLNGNGQVWMDDVSFDMIVVQGLIDTNSSELSNQSINNLVAFAKIYGNIKYYYPGFEAMETDWDDFALNGVETIEMMKNNTELVSTLKNLYKPIAPALSITIDNESKNKDLYKNPPENALENIAVAWLHKGPVVSMNVKYFSSEIRNLYHSLRQREAPLVQVIDAISLRGAKIVFSVNAKANVISPSGQAQLWIGIDDKYKRAVSMVTNEADPITENKWKKYSIEMIVPEYAELIRIALVLIGDGQVLFDKAELITDTTKSKTNKNILRNGDFEERILSDKIIGWKFPKSSITAGYKVENIKEDAFEGKRCLKISSDKLTRIAMPEINEIYSEDLTSNISFSVPLTLYVDSISTLPKPDSKYQKIKANKPSDFVMTGDDRYSRFAITTILWNIYRHFSLLYDKNILWDNILRQSLANAAMCRNNSEFLDVLNRMLVQINDGQGKVWLTNDDIQYGIPILWKWIGNKLIIHKTGKDAENIELGSEVIEIDDMPLSKVIEDVGKIINSNTKSWKLLRTIAEIKAGDKDSKISLKIKTPKGEMKNVELVRNILLGSMVDDKPPRLYIFDDNYYYFDLTTLTDRGMKNIIASLKDTIKSANGIIFDLRGQTSMSESFLGIFSEGSMQSVRRRIPVFAKPGNKPCSFINIQNEITAKNPYIKGKIVFMIDEKTSGNSEIIAALVKHYKLGILIGSPSAGSVDEVFGINLPGEFNASIIGMTIDDPKIRQSFINGIVPDIIIEQTIGFVTDKKDPIWEKALEIVKN